MFRFLIAFLLAAPLAFGQVEIEPFVSASGGFTVGTANTIPKWNATPDDLVDSLLSDDNTNVTLASGQFLIPDGTAGAPSMSFAGDPDNGVYLPDTNKLSISTAATERLRFNNNGQLMAIFQGTAANPTFTRLNDFNTGVYFGASDAVLMSAGGTLSGSFSASGFLPRTYVFANLPASANGNMVYCSDCTVADPCAGSGTGAIAKRLDTGTPKWVCN